MTDTLWALYVPGCDEVWAMVSRGAAVTAAIRHNRAVVQRAAETGDRASEVYARAIEWPWDAETHAQCLADGESLVLSSNALGIPDGLVAEIKGGGGQKVY